MQWRSVWPRLVRNCYCCSLTLFKKHQPNLNESRWTNRISNLNNIIGLLFIDNFSSLLAFYFNCIHAPKIFKAALFVIIILINKMYLWKTVDMDPGSLKNNNMEDHHHLHKIALNHEAKIKQHASWAASIWITMATITNFASTNMLNIIYIHWLKIPMFC